jgi:hypothetical protein
VLFKRPPNAFLLAYAPDGNLFPMSMPMDTAESTPERITVVLNWPSLLKK